MSVSRIGKAAYDYKRLRSNRRQRKTPNQGVKEYDQRVTIEISMIRKDAKRSLWF